MRKVTESVKYFSKLSLNFILNVFKIVFLNGFYYIIFCFIGVYILREKGNALTQDHISLFSTVKSIFIQQPISISFFIVLVVSLPFLIYRYSVQYSMDKVINKLVRDKATIYIIPLMDKLILQLKEKQPIIIRDTADLMVAKANFTIEIAKYTDNKVLSRILTFAIQKINFEEFLETEENIDFYTILKNKTIEQLEMFKAPSWSNTYMLMSIQLVYLLVLYYVNY